MIFIDSNVPMYLIGASHPNKTRAVELVNHLARAGERLVTDVEVYQEILHRYTAIRRPDAIDAAWRGEPWTLGAYSAPRPGQAHQRDVLARPIDDRLFFAGEATTRDTFATCHGASLTGRRAVAEIVTRLRGTSGSG